MIYRAPRPFMLTSGFGNEIGHCPLEFGTPSGHALISSGMSIYMALEMSQYHQFKKRTFKICLLISILYTFCVGMKRAFNIAHSFDQIFLGWMIGTWASIFFYTHGSALLTNHFQKPEMD